MGSGQTKGKWRGISEMQSKQGGRRREGRGREGEREQSELERNTKGSALRKNMAIYAL